jgi:hypothetical protein
MVRFTREACEAADGWQDVCAAIHDRYPESDFKRLFNHSIPNGAIIVMALLKGGGGFTRTVGISVMGGLDTDCNGATAGSIMGGALGTEGIPAHWTDPLNDTIASDVKGMPRVRISDMARRMFDVARQNARFA